MNKIKYQIKKKSLNLNYLVYFIFLLLICQGVIAEDTVETLYSQLSDKVNDQSALRYLGETATLREIIINGEYYTYTLRLDAGRSVNFLTHKDDKYIDYINKLELNADFLYRRACGLEEEGDWSKAEVIYRRLAGNLNHQKSQVCLGTYYKDLFYQEGEQRYLDTAKRWYSKAAEKGNTDAQQLLDGLEEEYPSEQEILNEEEDLAQKEEESKQETMDKINSASTAEDVAAIEVPNLNEESISEIQEAKSLRIRSLQNSGSIDTNKINSFVEGMVINSYGVDFDTSSPTIYSNDYMGEVPWSPNDVATFGGFLRSNTYQTVQELGNLLDSTGSKEIDKKTKIVFLLGEALEFKGPYIDSLRYRSIVNKIIALAGDASLDTEDGYRLKITALNALSKIEDKDSKTVDLLRNILISDLNPPSQSGWSFGSSYSGLDRDLKINLKLKAAEALGRIGHIESIEYILELEPLVKNSQKSEILAEAIRSLVEYNNKNVLVFKLTESYHKEGNYDSLAIQFLKINNYNAMTYDPISISSKGSYSLVSGDTSEIGIYVNKNRREWRLAPLGDFQSFLYNSQGETISDNISPFLTNLNSYYFSSFGTRLSRDFIDGVFGGRINHLTDNQPFSWYVNNYDSAGTHLMVFVS